MPELPEVETARRATLAVARGRRIIRVEVVPDPLVYEGASPTRWKRALLGRRVLRVHRHGKHLWLELDRRPWPVIHFGMTGGIHTPLTGTVRLMSHGKQAPRTGWPPRFSKLILGFDGGGELAVADARRLGRLRLRENPPEEPPVSLLGFDAWRGLPSFVHFRDLVRTRSAPVKAVLLDQSFAAGVGNWIADEVLYQARIDPRRRAGTLTDDEIRRLRNRLRSVVAVSVRASNDSDRYPRTWLFHDRWGRNPKAYTARGEKIRHDTISGRTTAWVPAVQR